MSVAPVFVSGETARKVFRWEEAIDALRATYARPIPPGAIPPRSIGSAERNWLRTLPAIPPGGRYFGAKLMGMATGAPTPGVEYVIVLFDRQTSRIAGFVDANSVTGLRTAATSATALDRLAPAGATKLAVLGSGLEASMHVRAFASVRPLSEIAVFSPTPGKREAFAEAATRDLGVPTRAVASAEAAVEGAGVVLAAARSHGERPILHADWLAPGAMVVSIGSTVPEQREIDVSVVERSDLIVADALEEVLEQTGDMIAARQAGIAFHAKAIGLADLLSGSQDERVGASRAPLYKSVGGGLQDIVVAELILTRALESGLATPLPMRFETKH
ncbi:MULTISPECIES: ornithine cyclodeaminase family protein [Pseudoxanthomonas]|uniref:Alanine dehydrogenase n=1 Tax=Pseudoxanthomonas winnipegensis TaxID=2480810 RepID=A0AAW8GDG1_9GAMM|nr:MULTISPECIES: ornithine cyclodeaminase family protein [Pseudoxanthomonas]MDQ1120464.1 alanine dehydrogenase [Pseudoxanthomonas winnipegensis]MDQ1133683.1 alanine dehydrogenase [Pseudoxanthomonas winnipegensis]MDR6140077.1 alanine dehydrogenase [Pseudoxanthomonas sp. SORGH_AS_0997]